jgi:serine/threonine protein phosphatase PrpC
MGNCCNSQPPDFPEEVKYDKYVYLDVFSLYASHLDLLPTDSRFCLSDPKNQINLNSFLCDLPMKISGCMLPGMDFRIGQTKTCQDNYTCLVHNNSLLCLLGDGHGPEGHQISDYSISFCLKFFKKHFQSFTHDSKSAMTQMLQKCDKRLLSETISENSGSTMIVLFIYQGIIHCGSLGDSRSIIGSLSDVAEVFRPRNNKFFRKILTDRALKAEALTKDQKPNLNEEMMRIKLSGGSVERSTDPFGRHVGPFRVWSKEGSGPGLAMSRSLGDQIAKTCGVISIPLYMEKTITPGQDLYIVIASDGVWDVMQNIEVINFVDKWKGRCVNVDNSEYPAFPSNSSISRLLAEEARFRWLGLAQEERVPIDDISCVVIDFAVELQNDTSVENPQSQILINLSSPNGGELT